MGIVDTDDAQASPLDVTERAVACLAGLDLDGVPAGELSSLVERFQHLRCRLEAAEASVLSRWAAAKAYRLAGSQTRPEGRRVGKVGVSPWASRWRPCH